MTQLQLIEGAAPPRPERRSQQIYEKIADGLLPEVIRWLGDDHSPGDEPSLREELIRVLDRSWEFDGFQLAKALTWDGNTELVEILDRAGWLAYEAHDALVAAWVAEWDIKPAFSVGDRVRFVLNGINSGDTLVGEIIEIIAKKAEYLIFVESLGHIRRDSGKTGSYGVYIAYERVEGPEVMT